MSLITRIESKIRDVKDFPKKGIIFKDITPLLQDPQLCHDIVEMLAKQLEGTTIDAIACVESRGYWFGALLSQKLQVPFVPIRKKGKLPYKTVSYNYALEYGTATIEMHKDAIPKGAKILIHDDLLATGGTATAAAELVKQFGEVVGFSFLIDLTFLNGKEKLKTYSSNIHSIITY